MSVELCLLSRVSFRGEEITGPRLRDLLALLAGDLRAGCGTARLIDELWPEEQPENPGKAVQILVSRVRGQLGADVVVRTATGYRLALEPGQVDSSVLLLHASASAQHARNGEHRAALEEAEAGLGLWDGDGIDGEGAVAALRRDRAVTRASLVRARALALARLGRHAEAVEALAALTGQRPHDEEVLLELLRAEAATAGPSAALARYENYRRALRDQLGTEPGAAVRELHQRLLQGEPVRHGVAHAPNALLGREDDLAAVSALVRSARVTSIVGPGGSGRRGWRRRWGWPPSSGSCTSSVSRAWAPTRTSPGRWRRWSGRVSSGSWTRSGRGRC
ncbi:BTAD domain-containing putative transcriptional regulator [Actinokineospora soli]|uniref:BTAD domain-containing putative transcriptional regulator n=1 Tax=Actinokineospora soli TaxID=1048753 RepID=A0ABW2TJ27_9PSEU